MSISGITHARSIFIVEDEAIYRMGLGQFVGIESDLELIAESGELRGAAERIFELSPDLVITELSLPDGSGLELIKELRAAMFGGKILVLSRQDESLYSERALRAGANGYVMKSEVPEVILKAIRSVLLGDVFISETMNARILKRMTGAGSAGSQPERGAIEHLTDREIQVLELIGSGLMTKDIAERLSISSKTVDTHRINIRQKLGIPDVNELIRYAVHWLGAGTANGRSNGDHSLAS